MQNSETVFNRYVIELCNQYPTDGTFQYSWIPTDSIDDGVTEDLYYLGKKIAKKNAQGTCFCCGLTLEIFFKACQKIRTNSKNKDNFIVENLKTSEDMMKLKYYWYCGGDNIAGCLKALTFFGIGIQITEFKNAIPGDFIQFWRTNGSGHSVVFLGWVYSVNGSIQAIKYFSSQKSTNGIGVNQENLDNIIKEKIFIVRCTLKHV